MLLVFMVVTSIKFLYDNLVHRKYIFKKRKNLMCHYHSYLRLRSTTNHKEIELSTFTVHLLFSEKMLESQAAKVSDQNQFCDILKSYALLFLQSL